MRMLGNPILPTTSVRNVSNHERYLIAIAKAIVRDFKILIMDEPTAGLTEQERSILFELIETYKREGAGIVYITHKLNEIHRICDRVTVLRDGRHVITGETQHFSEEEMARLMVGKDVTLFFPPLRQPKKQELLRVEGLSKLPHFENVNFKLHEGEIIGIAGLAGSGRSELVKTIFGHTKKDSGNIIWRHKKVQFKHPVQAVSKKIGFVNENRLKTGLFMNMSVKNNLTISSLQRLNRWKFVKVGSETEQSIQKVIDLDIKLGHLEQQARFLSGGNQQKVILGRWLMAGSEIYLLDEPTQGIDIASRSDIYLKIHELASNGGGILIISSDVRELLGLCNRILVMDKGTIVADLTNNSSINEGSINKFMSQ